MLNSVAADKVHYVNGRGLVQHTFDAEVPEELSVYPGEEVGLNNSQHCQICPEVKCMSGACTSYT